MSSLIRRSSPIWCPKTGEGKRKASLSSQQVPPSTYRVLGEVPPPGPPICGFSTDGCAFSILVKSGTHASTHIDNHRRVRLARCGEVVRGVGRGGNGGPLPHTRRARDRKFEMNQFCAPSTCSWMCCAPPRSRFAVLVPIQAETLNARTCIMSRRDFVRRFGDRIRAVAVGALLL